METKTLEEIEKSLKSIEFYLQQICEIKVERPKNDFWDEYLDLQLYIFLEYRIRISEVLYMEWHNKFHKGKKISHKTLFSYAFKRRNEVLEIINSLK